MKKMVLIVIILCLIMQGIPLFGSDNVLAPDLLQDPYFQKLIAYSYRLGAINKNGAAYQNVKSKGKFDIWYQQICWYAIVAGIGKNRQSDILAGIKAIKYGFGKMDKDGSFENSSAAGAIRFLSAFAKSYYEIERSRYKGIYLARLDSHLPELKKAAYWILNSPQWETEKSRIMDYANQVIGIGMTFKLIGTILNDKNIIEYGEELFYQGINKQTGEGIFPEKGGYDSSYQAVSLQFIEFYYIYAANDEEKNSIFAKLKYGWEWELARIKEPGEIMVDGNTRTGLNQERFRGESKGVNYLEAALSLIYWAHIAEDNRLRGLARNVFEYGLKLKSR